MISFCALVFAAHTPLLERPAVARAASAKPATTHAERALAKLAPADEYFGPLRMSGIAIRMRIDALGRRYHARTESDDDLLHDAANVETAMHSWAARYPHDTWLPPTAFHLAELYADVQTPVARGRALATFRFVAKTYPKTHDGHLARLRLAQGFPPLHDESPVIASPAPNASPSATPEPSASVTPSGSASTGPGAPASPSASARPNATTSPLPSTTESPAPKATGPASSPAPSPH